jgi:predicted nucleic acid-binding protein
MPACYLDASAAVKLYLPEIGSAWVTELVTLSREDSLLSVELIVVEVACALARAQRSGRISAKRRDRSLAVFSAESREIYALMSVSKQILRRATQLARKYPLRAYDAVHLAAALDSVDQMAAAGLPAPIFVSADETLLIAARAEGLSTENPNDHDTVRAIEER